MTRPRNDRLRVLKTLRVMKGNLATMVAVWDQAQHTKDFSVFPRKLIPLLPAEKVENQTDRWRQLAEFMRATMKHAAAIAEFAERMAEDTKGIEFCPNCNAVLDWHGDKWHCPGCENEWGGFPICNPLELDTTAERSAP